MQGGGARSIDSSHLWRLLAFNREDQLEGSLVSWRQKLGMVPGAGKMGVHTHAMPGRSRMAIDLRIPCIAGPEHVELSPGGGGGGVAYT